MTVFGGCKDGIDDEVAEVGVGGFSGGYKEVEGRFVGSSTVSCWLCGATSSAGSQLGSEIESSAPRRN